MAELTTSSPLSEFDSDLHRFASKLEYAAEELATRHQNIFQQQMYNRQHGNSYPRDLAPDREALLLGFTILASNLRMILNRISDLEDLTDALDDEDETELIHHNGEIFALKSMYLELIKSHKVLEDRRLIATSKGMHLRNFLYAAASKGLPSGDDIYGGGHVISNGAITANQLQAQPITRSNLMLNPTPKWATMNTPPPIPKAFATIP